MRLIEELFEEHELFDHIAGALVRLAGEPDDVVPELHAEILRVLVDLVIGFHHAREEDALFAVLVDRCEVAGSRGPLAVLAEEHRTFARLVDRFANTTDAREATTALRGIAAHLWEHIDKENSVLLPTARDRLARNGINRLDGRPPTEEEDQARRLAADLIRRIPPIDDPNIVRGDGCVACSAFAVTCRGIEAEWWNTWDYEHHRLLDEG